MLNSSEWIDRVLVSSDGPRVKHMYGIDTENYNWVESYIRDKTARKGIDNLKTKISEIHFYYHFLVV